MEDNLNMEYLPDDPNEKELRHKEKIEKKLKEFREYIVDKGVVKAFTRVLLSLKYSETRPKNPNRAIREFFADYHDSSVEMVKSLNEEIIVLRNANEKLHSKVLDLEEELEKEKRKFRVKQLFQMFYDSDSTNKNGQISTKLIIEKLSGNKKFEVDEKLYQDDFVRVLDVISEGVEAVLDSLVSNMELALSGQPIYKDDLENVVYKRIIQVLKELKKGGNKK